MTDTDPGGEMDRDGMLDWLSKRARSMSKWVRSDGGGLVAKQMAAPELARLERAISVIEDSDDDKALERLRDFHFHNERLEEEFHQRLDDWGVAS